MFKAIADVLRTIGGAIAMIVTLPFRLCNAHRPVQLDSLPGDNVHHDVIQEGVRVESS